VQDKGAVIHIERVGGELVVAPPRCLTTRHCRDFAPPISVLLLGFSQGRPRAAFNLSTSR
jgi:hypothetical protein